MKSNQERSNECLPPKKRELLASNLAMEDKAVGVAPGPESQRGENLAWLASVASGHNSCRYTDTPAEGGGASRKLVPAAARSSPPSSSSSSPLSSPSGAPASVGALTSLSAVYTSPLTQHAEAVQYAQVPRGLQFVSQAYAGHYAGYISSPLTSSSTPCALPQRAQLEGYPTASAPQAPRAEPHQQLGSSAGLLTAAGVLPLSHPIHPSSQYVQIASAPLSVATARALPAPATHVPLHLHPSPTLVPHTLTLASSQVVVQYTEGLAVKKDDGQAQELLNGELEKGRPCGPELEPHRLKQGCGGARATANSQNQQSSYEAQQVVLPADYTKEALGLHASVMLVASRQGSGAEAEGSLEKFASSITQSERCTPCLGKVASRGSPFGFSSPEGPKAPAAGTTQNTPETLPSVGLPATSFYPAAQPPIIGYIASGGHTQQQQSVSYHASLPQHLLIPTSQPLLIPVSSSPAAELELPSSVATAAVPQAYVTTALPKCDIFRPGERRSPAPYHAATVVQTELHLPVIPATASGAVLTSPPAASPPPPPTSCPALPPPASCPTLPPYFMKGSIIQLADGELKRVEDLRTEDFIQSAEISGDLKIDSSTVERIEGSQTPNSAIIQFAVGEHRAQVSVEVLEEYPFFVFGQGWSSCCPDRTTQLFELSCAKLAVGDICISLTLKDMRNGSLKKSSTLDAPGSNGDAQPKGLKVGQVCRERGSQVGERKNDPKLWTGTSGGPAEPVSVQPISENGELECKEKAECLTQNPSKEVGGADKPMGRKRRWSAPEGRKVERSDEEPPLTLPKPSFIPQEVKICIEGRSIIGK